MTQASAEFAVTRKRGDQMGTCPNHPGVAATGRCAGCAEEFCSNCLVDVRPALLRSLQGDGVTGQAPTAVVTAQEQGRLKHQRQNGDDHGHFGHFLLRDHS